MNVHLIHGNHDINTFFGFQIECIERLVCAFLFTMLFVYVLCLPFSKLLSLYNKSHFYVSLVGPILSMFNFLKVTWISSIWNFWYISIVFIKFNIFIQMSISFLFFNIWYHPNYKLMEMPCLVIQSWCTIQYEFNICRLGQPHKVICFSHCMYFMYFHNSWGNTIWDNNVTTKHTWEPKTNMGFYLVEKDEVYWFVSQS